MEVIAEGNMVYPKYQNITCIIRMKRARSRCIFEIQFLKSHGECIQTIVVSENTNAHDTCFGIGG